MNYFILILTLFMFVSGTVETFAVSPTAAVTVAGSIIKSKDADTVKKYKRKDCPVCKGKGWYISGDGIKKVDCGYCEPEKAEPPKTTVIVHPPAVIKQECQNGVCSPQYRNVR